MRLASVTPAEAQRLAREGRAVIVDVREKREWERGHVDAALLIPVNELPARHHEIPRGTDVIVMCRSGSRSAIAQQLLHRLGFERVANLEGGVLAWSKSALPLRKP